MQHKGNLNVRSYRYIADLHVTEASSISRPIVDHVRTKLPKIDLRSLWLSACSGSVSGPQRSANEMMIVRHNEYVAPLSNF